MARCPLKVPLLRISRIINKRAWGDYSPDQLVTRCRPCGSTLEDQSFVHTRTQPSLGRLEWFYFWELCPATVQLMTCMTGPPRQLSSYFLWVSAQPVPASRTLPHRSDLPAYFLHTFPATDYLNFSSEHLHHNSLSKGWWGVWHSASFPGNWWVNLMTIPLRTDNLSLPVHCTEWAAAPGTCLRWVVVVLLSRVWIFCDMVDCSPPGSLVRGILQARSPGDLPHPELNLLSSREGNGNPPQYLAWFPCSWDQQYLTHSPRSAGKACHTGWGGLWWCAPPSRSDMGCRL